MGMSVNWHLTSRTAQPLQARPVHQMTRETVSCSCSPMRGAIWNERDNAHFRISATALTVKPRLINCKESLHTTQDSHQVCVHSRDCMTVHLRHQSHRCEKCAAMWLEQRCLTVCSIAMFTLHSILVITIASVRTIISLYLKIRYKCLSVRVLSVTRLFLIYFFITNNPLYPCLLYLGLSISDRVYRTF